MNNEQQSQVTNQTRQMTCISISQRSIRREFGTVYLHFLCLDSSNLLPERSKSGIAVRLHLLSSRR